MNNTERWTHSNTTVFNIAYHCESIGHISEEAVKKYIKDQKNV